VTLSSGINRFKLGDSFSYEVTDGLTKLTERYTHTVTSADDMRVVMNNGEYEFDQMGGLLKNSFGVKDPAILQVPADITEGKKWRSVFTNTNINGVTRNYYDFQVVSLEDLATAMGTIRANGRNNYTVMTNTLWIDPRTMHIIRSDRQFRENGRIIEFTSTVMTSMKKVR
jgi:hypothetical protein